jgi:hypothetical protein
MSTRVALALGTVLSLAVSAAWSFTASLTIGAAAAPHLTRNDADGRRRGLRKCRGRRRR